MAYLKGIVFIIVLFGAWTLYAIIGSSPCERIYRGAAPVRVSMEVFSWVLHHWADSENRIWLIKTSFSIDHGFQNFLGLQFYGKSKGDLCLPTLTVPRTEVR